MAGRGVSNRSLSRWDMGGGDLELVSGWSSCYEGHPALPLGDGLVVYGGSCSSPVVEDADVYVGLDRSMRRSTMAHPWTAGAEVYFPVVDRAAPKDADEFRAMVTWLVERVRAGDRVHVGCIGGHGRTGTVLAAMVAEMGLCEDAIGYVRKNYCARAVESSVQVNFLVDVYGVSEVEGSDHKAGGGGVKTKGKGGGWARAKRGGTRANGRGTVGGVPVGTAERGAVDSGTTGDPDDPGAAVW